MILNLAVTLGYPRFANSGHSKMRSPAKTALTRQNILRTLRQNRTLLDKYSVKRIAVFGSFATGAPTTSSDIDLFVEFERPTYDNLLGLSRHLERLLGRKVGILTPDGLGSIRVERVAQSIRKALAYV